MNIMQRKTKMVSFRVSPQEYRKLNDACQLRGVESISELARFALKQLMTAEEPLRQPTFQESLAAELTDLRSRVQTLTADIDRIAARLPGDSAH